MERTTLVTFFTCMPLCALLVLGLIWIGADIWPVWVNKLAFTLFVIGLANFLTWFTYILRRIAAR